MATPMWTPKYLLLLMQRAVYMLWLLDGLITLPCEWFTLNSFSREFLVRFRLRVVYFVFEWMCGGTSLASFFLIFVIKLSIFVVLCTLKSIGVRHFVTVKNS